MVMLYTWVLQLCTYTSWMQYKKQLRNCVRLYFHSCCLVIRPESLGCCASCWIPIASHHSRLSALPLPRSHIPAVCDMSLITLCCYKVLWSMIHWIYLSMVFWAWLPLFGQPFHHLQEREGLLRDGLLFIIFYRDTLQSNIWLNCIVVTIMLHTVYDNVKKSSYNIPIIRTWQFYINWNQDKSAMAMSYARLF